MNYKFIENDNFEAFASGAVIRQKPGFTNYPVRLACEVFMRSVDIWGGIGKAVVYDPCCGAAYMATTLGFLCGERIERIFCSDISEVAIDIAAGNLSLLTADGLASRKAEVAELFRLYGKESHKNTLGMIDNLQERKVNIESYVFKADILEGITPKSRSFLADIVITDVPYGGMAAWSDSTPDSINRMLDGLLPVLKRDSVVAVSSDKKQKISNNKFSRCGKLSVGKRKIEFLRVLEGVL